MKKDSFSFDVAPGGLRTAGEIKILICYLLKTVGVPLSRSALDEAIQENGIANYFDVGQALTELCDNGSIARTEDHGSEAYQITEQGRESADLLETTLSFTVRDKAVRSAMRLLSKIRNERENHVEIQKTQGGYLVTCTVLDRQLELMTVRLLVADALQAELVKNRFLDDPQATYQSILEQMIGDDAIFS